MNLTEYEQLQPHVKLDGITFLTPNSHCAWRVDTLLTKEPDTIAWIKTFKPDDIFFDVGSNMGQYALYAAVVAGVKRVYAFEPESQNFALLCRNIGINNLNERIMPWPLALSDKSGFDKFFVQSLQVGGSCSSYAEPVNFHLQPKQYAVTQGCAAITLDEFCEKYEYPTHIKIDVDGLEHKVLRGGSVTLHGVQSVLVELNTHLQEHMAIYELMEDYGFAPDVETANVARRKEGSFKGIGNVIFHRVTK
jgi:FkbM family methyltransferase